MKKLELRFENELGKVTTLVVDDLAEPVDPLQVSAAMDEIIASDVFNSSGGSYIAKKDARIVERTVEEIHFN